ncbi:hypothetical protein ACOBQX_17625 [Actinokineospora sp. G85]
MVERSERKWAAAVLSGTPAGRKKAGSTPRARASLATVAGDGRLLPDS